VFEHHTRVMNLIAQVKLTGKGAEELADAMLFTGDAPLPQPVEGSSGFAEKFAARGAFRELDLKTRVMRDSVSYMIFSEAFQALPVAAKSVVYRQIRERAGAAAMEKIEKSLKDLTASTDRSGASR
jgi:hypothetical protein